MSKLPDPFPSLLARIKRLEDLVNRIINGSAFSGTPIRPQADGSVQSDDFDGNLDNDDAGTKGWALSSLKAAFGELILRPGSIGNDSLTNPVVPDDVSFGVDDFAVTAGTYTLLGSASRTVPAGFTKALVNASAWMFARNPNTTGGVDGAGTDAIYCYVRVTGSDGDTDSKPKGQGISGFGGFTTATSGVGKLKEGLTPGSSLTFKVYGASSSQNLAADAQNTADLMGTVLWLR